MTNKTVIQVLAEIKTKLEANTLPGFEDVELLSAFAWWCWDMALTEAGAKDTIRATLILSQMGRKGAFENAVGKTGSIDAGRKADVAAGVGGSASGKPSP